MAIKAFLFRAAVEDNKMFSKSVLADGLNYYLFGIKLIAVRTLSTMEGFIRYRSAGNRLTIIS